ncbi:MAG: hypothetical protein ACOYLK_01785 [Sphingomonas sp.]
MSRPTPFRFPVPYRYGVVVAGAVATAEAAGAPSSQLYRLVLSKMK